METSSPASHGPSTAARPPSAPALAHGEPPVLQRMLELLARPGLLSFGLGLPDSALFPTAEWLASASAIGCADPAVLQYGPPDRSLKRHIASLVARRGITCAEDQIFVTAGAQQGLWLLTHLLTRPGDGVFVEEYTYPNFRQVLQQHTAHALNLPTGEAGLDVDALDDALRRGQRGALLYLMPDGHNPLGVSLPMDARHRLIAIARENALPIVEDDAYGLLSYERARPPLRAFEPDWVFYAGSLSKVLAPALRIGWVVVPERFVPTLAAIKEGLDLNTTTFAQRATAAYFGAADFSAHLERLRGEYGRRRDAMLEALRDHFPPGTRWTPPSGGFFVWVELPRDIDATRLLSVAIERENIAFVPGEACRAVPDGHGRHCLRLNFSNATPETIHDGIRRLGAVLRSLPSVE